MRKLIASASTPASRILSAEHLELADGERRPHLARPVDPLGHLETQLARNQRRLAMEAQIERLRAVAAADLQQVAKALGGEQRSLGADALQQRVDDERGAVLDEARLARVERSLADAVEDRFAQPIIGGRAFGVGDRAGLDIAGDEVGEGAADIDGDDIWHNVFLSFRGRALVDFDSRALDHVGPLRDAHCSILVTSSGVPIFGVTPAARSFCCTVRRRAHV